MKAVRRLRDGLQTQDRTSAFLILNQATGAATGILFWMLVSRLLALPPEAVGIGYAIVALGTAIGLVAKGGLDTALMRHAPGAGDKARGLARFALLFGTAAALMVTVAVAGASITVGALAELDVLGWAMVAAIALLLVVAWLQDAYFLAQGDAKATFQRNAAFSAARLILPLPLFLLVAPVTVPAAWALALVVSAWAGMRLGRRHTPPAGRAVPRGVFMRSAAKNVAGNAAEVLPGLLLVPLVLGISGAAAAGHFGMAWTAASLVLLASAAISRSALTEMVRRGGTDTRAAIRRAAGHNAALLLPACLVGILAAPWIMWLFGASYRAESTTALRLLLLSVPFVAPTYLYLALLRAREHALPLIVYPIALLILIFSLVPVFVPAWGVTGAAAAWLVASVPTGAWAMWRLTRTKETTHATQTIRGHPDPE